MASKCPRAQSNFFRLSFALARRCAFVASGVGGALSGKLPPARAVQIGVLLELVGVVGVAVVASQSIGWAGIAPFLFVYGIGIGLATAQLTGVIMVDVPMEKAGQARDRNQRCVRLVQH